MTKLKELTPDMDIAYLRKENGELKIQIDTLRTPTC